MEVAYVPYKEIDKKKWDECIFRSYNGLIYSTSTFLDVMADNWDGLVSGDYESVMPLPFRKKYSINYIYTPAFSQQMGVTGPQTNGKEHTRSFIEAIPKKFKYIDLNLNFANQIDIANARLRKNYLLDLGRAYADLEKGYSRSAKRNIAKARMNHIVISDVLPSQVIALHRTRFDDNVGYRDADYNNFETLLNTYMQMAACYVIAAQNTKGNLIAGSIYFLYKNRVTFICNGNLQEGLHKGATHLLMDHTIEKFSGTNYLLDFEGSDNPSFARFYEQYGATPENYRFVNIDRLGAVASFLKRNLYSFVARNK